MRKDKTVPTRTAQNPTQRPIIIVGNPRSGTTLLSMMLHAHPRLAIAPETRFTFKVYKRILFRKDLRFYFNRKKLLQWMINHPRSEWENLQLGPAKIMGLAEENIDSLGALFAAIFQRYAARWNKPRWGDKRPNYIRNLDTIVTLFPKAQIIHIIRDGRDCVTSLKQMKWYKRKTVGAIYKWIESMRMGQRARHLFRSDQYTEIYYESLIAQPEKTLRKICRFIGESYDVAMLNYHHVAGNVVPERKLKWKAGTTQKIYTKAMGKWQTGLEPWELDLTEMMAGKYLRRHGYTLSQEDPQPPFNKIVDYYRYCLRQRPVRFLTHRYFRLLNIYYRIRSKPASVE